MATLLVPDGTCRDVVPADAAEGFTLDELYALLGCQTVEAIAVPGGSWLVFDEDGKGRDLAYNAEATLVLHRSGGMPHDCVVGPALLCAHEELQ